MTENHWHASGHSIHLNAGPYAATIHTSGAALATLTHDATPLILSYDVTETAPGYAGKTLLPWPNRIRNGHYTWNDKEHQLPINDHTTNSALHGLTYNANWTVIESSTTSVTLEYVLLAHDGYPWPLHARTTYTLDAATGLRCEISVENLTDTDIPCGIGSHPYLTAGGTVDDWELHMHAHNAQRMDTNQLPHALVPASDMGLNFKHARSLNGLTIDTGFTGFPSGWWAVRVSNPQERFAVELKSTAPWAHIYTGDALNRRAIAVEPMSCPADAFNTAPADVILPARQRRELVWTLTARTL